MASYSTATLPSGTHTLLATYSGDTTYSPLVSNTVTVIVDPQPTQITLSANPATAAFGVNVTLQATVSSTSGTATGTVVFFDGTSQIGNTLLNTNGTAQVQTSTLALGVHAITAQFTGSTAFAASVSAPVQVVITGISTSTSLTATPNPSYPSQAVTFTASVSAVTAQPFSGSIRFFDGGASLGDVSLGSLGTATLSTSALVTGTHAIMAQYLGNGVLVASQSNVVQQVVLDSSFTISVPANISIQTQHHITFNITVTPLGQFAGEVKLNCGTLPEHATCTLSPESGRLSPSGGPQTVSVYLDTSDVIGYASAQPMPMFNPPAGRFLVALSIPLFLLSGVSTKRNRRSHRLLSKAAVLSLLMIGSLSVGCSGKYPASVSPGTYTLHFTGVSTSPPVSQSAVTQLTVTP